MHKYQLDTPCLIIDINQLKNNLVTMQQHCFDHNVGLRPHAKTHKCSRIAKMQIEHGAIGISVSKVSEAKVLAENTVPGILITSPVVTPIKIQTLMECLKLQSDLFVVVDNISNAEELQHAANAQNLTLNLLIDIDAGIGRTGVKFADVISFAEQLKNFHNLKLQGIQCYAGNLQHISSYQARLDASLSIMYKAGAKAAELKALGFCCDIVTGTGTGTYDIDVQAKQVTEIQPGSYTVMDVEYNAIACKESTHEFKKFLNSMTLLTSVISNNQPNHVTVDAGLKALYLNDHKPKIINCSGLQYEWGGFGDEHGKVLINSSDATHPQLGDVLELIVPHCDPTINLFDKFFIVDGDHVVDQWAIDLRGKSQ